MLVWGTAPWWATKVLHIYINVFIYISELKPAFVIFIALTYIYWSCVCVCVFEKEIKYNVFGIFGFFQLFFVCYFVVVVLMFKTLLAC